MLAVLAVGFFVIELPKYSALLLGVAPEYASGLAALGLSSSAFVAAINGIHLFTMLAFSAVGVLIFWRRSDEWVGVAGSLALVTFGAIPTFLKFGVRVPGMWAVVILIQVSGAKWEERVLTEMFGEEDAAYRKKTWF